MQYSVEGTNLVVGDLGAVKRDVEVDTDENLLARELNVLDGELVGKRHFEGEFGQLL